MYILYCAQLLHKYSCEDTYKNQRVFSFEPHANCLIAPSQGTRDIFNRDLLKRMEISILPVEEQQLPLHCYTHSNHHR